MSKQKKQEDETEKGLRVPSERGPRKVDRQFHLLHPVQDCLIGSFFPK